MYTHDIFLVYVSQDYLATFRPICTTLAIVASRCVPATIMIMIAICCCCCRSFCPTCSVKLWRNIPRITAVYNACIV